MGEDFHPPYRGIFTFFRAFLLPLLPSFPPALPCPFLSLPSLCLSYGLPPYSYCICTSLFIIPPPSPLTALSILPFHLLTFIFSYSAMPCIQLITLNSKYISFYGGLPHVVIYSFAFCRPLNHLDNI